jgi:hypothetical protein
MSLHTKTSAIDRLLAGIEAASIPEDVFTDDAVLDATVPNWRFSVHGRNAVRDQLAQWYADPGRFEALQRTPLAAGELVELTLTWTEQGVEHTCHQAHILTTRDDRVSTDTMFCGGRWPAELVAEMNAEA